jgi:hypothetical protein
VSELILEMTEVGKELFESLECMDLKLRHLDERIKAV